MESRPKLTVTVEEAASLLGISRTLAYELVARDELPTCGWVDAASWCRSGRWKR